MKQLLSFRVIHTRTLSQLRITARTPRLDGSRNGLVTCRVCKIAVLSGDGIGPEICKVAVDLLKVAGDIEGVSFEFTDAFIGGAAIDAAGSPLPEETLQICRTSDAVLLAAIGGYRFWPRHSCRLSLIDSRWAFHSGSDAFRYKWDTLPPEQRPEKGLLNLRAGLGTFANLRPAVVLSHLADASTLKREVVDGVDIMIVRELVGGIYFGQPRVCPFCASEKSRPCSIQSQACALLAWCPHPALAHCRASRQTKRDKKWALTPWSTLSQR